MVIYVLGLVLIFVTSNDISEYFIHLLTSLIHTAVCFRTECWLSTPSIVLGYHFLLRLWNTNQIDSNEVFYLTLGLAIILDHRF